MPESEKIIMVCVPVRRMPIAPIPSSREACGECGIEVWVDATIAHHGCICMDCAARLPGEVDIAVLPGVRETLHRHGMNDDEIGRVTEFAQHTLRGPRREG